MLSQNQKGDNEDDETFLCGWIEDDRPETKMKQGEREVAFKRMRGQLEDVIREFDEQERKILEMRFGLVDNVSHTLEDVMEEFSVTRERIRQIEAKALEKIKKSIGENTL